MKKIYGIVVLAAMGWCLPSQAMTFTVLDALPSINSTGGIAYGMSQNAEYVAGYSASTQVISPVRWDSSGAAMGFALNNSLATAISGDGHRIAGYGFINNQSTAFWLDIPSNTLVVDLFGPSTPNYYQSSGMEVTGMSGDGATVVGKINGLAVKWEIGKGTTALDILGAYNGAANAISNDASVIVGSVVPAGYNSFYSPVGTGPQVVRWINGVPELISQLYGTANGVSSDGQYIVGNAVSKNGTEGFLWSEKNGNTWLGDIPGGEFYSSAADVSDQGNRVVGFSRGIQDNPMIFNRAFLWEPGTGLQDLVSVLQAGGADLHGCALQNATAISADGRWVAGGAICSGSAGFPYGGFGYLADLGLVRELPEPSSSALFLLGATVFLFRRKANTAQAVPPLAD